MRSKSEYLTIIKPGTDWKILDIDELKEYWELFFFLVWRDIKVMYAQTILGLSWAIMQPIVQIVLFTLVFGKVAKLSTDGIPYVLFSTVAIIPWTYMSKTMEQSSNSLVTGQSMLGKIYFPRIIFPMTPVLARLIDFGISLFLVFAVILYYRILPTWNLLYFPLFFMLMITVPAGVGFWLSALTIRFRDVRHAMPFAVRMLMYTAPIVYSASSIPEKYRILYSLNPIVSVIEGFRSCFLGTNMPWLYIWPGIITAFCVLFSGALYFRRMERIFADVI